MATKAQIGAVIGLEGADVFTRTVKQLTQYTKEFSYELKALTSSFDGNTKTIQENNKQREILTKQLQTVGDKLKLQKTALEEAKKAMVEGQYASSDQAKALQDLQVEIDKTTAQYNTLENQINDLPSSIKVVTDAFKEGTKAYNEIGGSLVSIGSSLTKNVTAPLTAAAGVSVKTFADWESAFAGVKKTVEGTPEQLEALAQGIANIALTTASSREEIAGVAEVAGQLGVEIDDIEEFTRVMVMLGDSTNISADEAATAIAKIVNITEGGVKKYGVKNIMKLGNAIVNLGNNYATTESDIIHMSNRLAAGGKLAGLTTQEIFGLATAMSSVGITAEAGGTAMTQTLTAIEKEFAAFKKGAESDLPRIAEIANMSAEQFAQAWETKPAEAIQAFISGLGSLDEKGESATLVLDELGMAGIRQSNMLKSLALASDVMTDAINDSNIAFAQGNDLADEAAKRYETFDTKIKELKEAFKIFTSEVGADLAEALIPFIEKLTDLLTKMADGWRNLDQPTKDAIFSLLGIVAAAGPVIGAIGKVIIFVGKIKSSLEALGLVAKDAKGFGGLGKTVGGFATLFTGVTMAVTNFVDMWKNGWSLISEILKDVGIAIAAIGAVILGAPAAVAAAVAAVVAVVSSLVIWIKDHWEEVKTFFKNLYEGIKEWAEKSIEQIKQNYQRGIEYFTQLKEQVTQKVTELKENLINRFTEAKENAINLFTNLRDRAYEIFNNLREGLNQRVTRIKETIVNGFQNAINYIKSLPSQAWNWGKDIINSLANGISSAIGSVTSAVSNVANRIKSFLHFSEPDTGPLSNFHTYMPDMMKLMAQGINENAYLVEDALDNLASNMASRTTNNSSFNYGGVVINLNVPEGANGQQLVDEIENELTARTIRRKAVFA